MREPLPHWVTEAMLRLEQNGEEAWLVGGCVRDRLLGRPVHDYDLTVSCLPDRTAWLFRDLRLVEDGRKHGTIGVVTEGGVLEMTTFRADGEYRDHRHPESVRFVPDLREDLARRDFTVNAMALSCQGELRDPFGGQADLAARLLRCVGDPRRRFREDALRILRCARFASELGFRVEEATLRAGRELAGEAAAVSRERITAEWEKYLAGHHFAGALELLPLWEGVFPGLGRLPASWKAALCRAPSPESRALLLAGGLWEVRHGSAPGGTEDWDGAVRELCAPLRLPGNRERLFRETAGCLALPPAESFREVWRRSADDSLPAYRAALEAAAASDPARKQELDWLSRVESGGYCRSLRELAVSGRELTARGIPAGPALGQLLRELLEAVIAGEAENTPAALLALAEQKWRNQDGQADGSAGPGNGAGA